MRLVYTATLLCLSWCFAPASVAAQSPESVLEQDKEGFIARDADFIARYLSPEVGISMGGTTRMYDRNQALYVIRQFMQDFPSTDFRLQHQGRSGETLYAIAEYRLQGGGRFEVNIFIRLQGSTIAELRFEPV